MLEAEEEAIPERAARVERAIINAGLAPFNIQAREFDTYGSDTYTMGGLFDATSLIRRDLIIGHNAAGVQGVAVIKAGHLSASLVVAGNVMQDYAAVQGREYSSQEKSNWKLVLSHLWQVIKAENKQWYEAEKLGAQLCRKLQRRLQKRNVEAGALSLVVRAGSGSPSPMVADFDFLIDFLTLCCWNEQEARNARAEHRDLPRSKKCVIM